MDKFAILPCIVHDKDKDEHNYGGYVVGLCNVHNPNFIIYFPVVDEGAHIINFLLNPTENKTPAVDLKTLSIFKTMIETWRASNRFLSGIVMDVENNDSKDGMIIVSVYLSDTNTGKIEAIVQLNFLHAVVIAAMEQMPVILSENLLQHIAPDEDHPKNTSNNDEEVSKKEKSRKKYPKDKNIIDIARKIMSGKIK